MGEERAPIEVELVEHDAEGAARPSPAGQPSRTGGSAVSDRSVITIVVAAVVAAGAVGVVAGRASVGGETADDTTPEVTSDTATSTTAEPAVEELIAPVSPAAQAAAGSETDEPSIETSTIRVDDRLAGIDLQVVAPRIDGSWARLDLRDGTLDEIAPDDAATRGHRDAAITAGEGWFTFKGDAGRPTTAVWRDDAATWGLVDLGRGWQTLREGDSDRFWRIRDPFFGSATTLELVGLDGTLVGGRIDIPAGAFVQGSDPAGGVIVSAGGRLFAVTPDGRTTLAGGELLAASETSIATWSCDDALRCGIAITDRSTGEVQRIEAGDDDPWAGNRLLSGFGFARGDLGAALSPDDSHLVLFVGVPAGIEVGVFDVGTGGYQRVAYTNGSSKTAWTPDSRYLLFADGGAPMAFDRTTGETFPIDADGDLVGWTEIVAVA